MAGINTYHPPVAPDVPAPDMTVARIVASADLAGSFMRGMAGVAQINAQKRSAELATQKLAQNTINDERAFQLQSRKLQHEFTIDTAKLALEQEMTPLERDIKFAELAYRKAQAENAAIVGISGMALQAQRNALRANTVLDFNTRIQEEGLLDPNPKNPVDYYARFQRVKDEFRGSSLPEITKQLKALEMTTQQHAIPMKQPNGAKRMIPVGEVVQKLNDPREFDAMFSLLQENEQVDAFSEVIKMKGKDQQGKDWQGDVRQTTNRVKPLIAGYLKQGQGVNWTRGTPRVYGTQPNQPIKSRAAVMSLDAEAPLPEPEKPSIDDLIPETESERTLKQARAALGRGAPREAVLEMLASKGIDASGL